MTSLFVSIVMSSHIVFSLSAICCRHKCVSSHNLHKRLYWQWHVFSTLRAAFSIFLNKRLWSKRRPVNLSRFNIPAYFPKHLTSQEEAEWISERHWDNPQRQNTEPGLNDSLMEEEDDAGSAAQRKNSENAVMKTNVCLMSALLCMRFKHLKCQTAAAGMFS